MGEFFLPRRRYRSKLSLFSYLFKYFSCCFFDGILYFQGILCWEKNKIKIYVRSLFEYDDCLFIAPSFILFGPLLWRIYIFFAFIINNNFKKKNCVCVWIKNFLVVVEILFILCSLFVENEMDFSKYNM